MRKADPAIAKYLEYMDKRSSQDYVKKEYRYLVNRFVERIGDKAVYDTEDLRQYIKLKQGDGNSNNTIRTEIGHLKVFFYCNDWSVELRRHELPKAQEATLEYLTPEEAKTLMKAAEKNPMMHLALRLAVILGCRRGELILMRRSEYRRPKIYHHSLKGSRSGWRELDLETCDMIEEYIRIRETSTDALLVNDAGLPVTVRVLECRLVTILKRTGLYRKQMGWHSIRRGLVTWLHNKRMSETEITRIVGWKSPEMVHHYIQVNREEAELEAHKLHPLLGDKERE